MPKPSRSKSIWRIAVGNAHLFYCSGRLVRERLALADYLALPGLQVDPVDHAVEIHGLQAIGPHHDRPREDVSSAGFPKNLSLECQLGDFQFTVDNDNVLLRNEIDTEAGDLVALPVPHNMTIGGM